MMCVCLYAEANLISHLMFAHCKECHSVLSWWHKCSSSGISVATTRIVDKMYREERMACDGSLAIFNTSRIKTVCSKLIPWASAAALTTDGWCGKGSSG